MRTSFAELGDTGGIGLAEAIKQFFDLTVTYFHIPRRFDGTPALLKLGAIGLGAVSLGIALHVNGTKLDVGLGEEAFTDGHQSGEVVLDKEHHPSEPALDQASNNGLPV